MSSLSTQSPSPKPLLSARDVAERIITQMKKLGFEMKDGQFVAVSS